jgi:hypothetical protein
MTTLPISEPVASIPANHVIVNFGSAITGDVQGKALLHLERYMRETLGVKAECYKATMADDNKRRRDMTPEQRDRL